MINVKMGTLVPYVKIAIYKKICINPNICFALIVKIQFI